TKTELNSKIDNTKTELENKGLNFAGNSGADVHRKLGEKLNIYCILGIYTIGNIGNFLTTRIDTFFGNVWTFFNSQTIRI
ncbi:hypothetical protein, partial [Acinetobacter baumannii]|uniref:hypothetical protein n=1 Tax=Acinetobacter baumannii TaxID=470 RepID=UPI001CB7BB09